MRCPNPHFKSSYHPSLLPWQPSHCPPTLCIVTTPICLLFTALKMSPWQINQCLVLPAQVTVNKADGAVPYNTLSLTALWVCVLQFSDRGCCMANFFIFIFFKIILKTTGCCHRTLLTWPQRWQYTKVERSMQMNRNTSRTRSFWKSPRTINALLT